MMPNSPIVGGGPSPDPQPMPIVTKPPGRMPVMPRPMPALMPRPDVGQPMPIVTKPPIGTMPPDQVPPDLNNPFPPTGATSMPYNPNGFQNFLDNSGFINNVVKGGHVPIWVHPNIASQLMKMHYGSGLVYPHPDINLSDLTQ